MKYFYILHLNNFRKDNLENENAKLLKELDRINEEHRILMTKQASASDMLIKEYKQQNVILQNAVSVPKSENDIISKMNTSTNLVRNLSHTTNDEESLAESPSLTYTPERGNKRKSKKGRSRKTKASSYKFSPVLCESQNTTSINSHADLRDKISSIRKASACEFKGDQQENENLDPSLVPCAVRSHDDSISSSSSFLGDAQQKSPAKRGRTSKRKRNIQKFENQINDTTTERRSLRKSIRDRAGSKVIMPPPSNTKIENSFLSPLIENEAAITVTTTTTLSPQKTRVSFITPQNKRKKLFNNETANEVH